MNEWALTGRLYSPINTRCARDLAGLSISVTVYHSPSPGDLLGKAYPRGNGTARHLSL